MDPLWIAEGRELLGTKETPGRLHNPAILEMWKAVRLPFQDDETPWCAAFVGACLERAGITSTRSGMARSYERWGVPAGGPVYGSIVVLWREPKEKGFGHVGFLVGIDSEDRLLILGGNQGDKVSILPFDSARVLAYRWPEHVEIDQPNVGLLAKSAAVGPASTNEA